MKRVNSHICSIAYPILEEAGVLAKTRLKEPEPDDASAPPPTAAATPREWSERRNPSAA